MDTLIDYSKISIEEIMSEPESLKFAFQPVIKTATGRVYGYEALMRPFPYTPMEVIGAYNRNGRLDIIEDITTYYGTKKFLELELEGKLFLNSFPATCMSFGMLTKLRELVHGRLKGRVVFEILEYTDFNEEAWNIKKTAFEKSGLNNEIALDDFGTGFNIDQKCIEIYSPNMIKVDRSIISSIDKFEEKQIRFNQLVQYMKKKNIAVLAEGVETKEEYDYIRTHGATYAQGYYLGMPKIYEVESEL